MHKASTKVEGNAKKIIENRFDTVPVYGDNNEYIETKIKIYSGSMIKNFQSKNIQKEKVPCTCLSIVMLDSNTLGRMQIWTRKDKNGEPCWRWFRKRFVWWVW